MRSPKKHKKLSSIRDDANHHGVGGGGGGEVRGSIERSEDRTTTEQQQQQLRRSSRVRRAPVILDASPAPPRKRRRKIGENEERISNCSNSWGSEDDLGSWRSRLRLRSRSRGRNKETRKVNSPRAKRKLYEELEEEKTETEGKSVENKLREGEEVMDHEKLSVVKSRRAERIRDSSDLGDDLSGSDVGLTESESEDEASVSSGETDDDEEEEVEEILDDSSEDEDDKDRADSQSRIGDNADRTVEQAKLPELSEHKEDEVKQDNDMEVVMEHRNLPEDGQENNDRHDIPKQEEKRLQDENAKKLVNDVPHAASTGSGKKRKEGRRCGLCGTAGDGKPPKRLLQDAAGSDHEAYSGSSVSEEPNYDEWDGFGDEPGWLGRLLGPVNDRYGIAGIWVHQQCAVWSPEVYFAGLGCLKNIRAALSRGRTLKCTLCGRPGATIGCRVDRCPRTYHLPCARASSCVFDHKKFLIACTDHRYLFQPQGPHYTQRIKKLKARKLKLEVKKFSNDAWRKDIEAEEKWMEKCGEDEEFLKRETKRLQRDMIRIAPVYIGGSQTGGEKLFEGWESVGGLQDVIRCMKEVVILPLLYPEFFENLGLTPPRGVLLHGYPGTGKTLVVRALIGSCARGDRKIAYFARKGADCLGKYVGDAERQLRLLFQVAERSQPSIIFFDEIDGLAPVRTRNQDQTHSSVVSTLLALMDGLKSRGSVIVIGATNRPDAVDPALRRPGRFDREIYFPLPSLKDRAAILTLHTRRWPKPVTGPFLQWIAARTAGFAGADLQALCTQAAITALKRHCPLQKILSAAAENSFSRKHPELPGFVVEERDWMEALLCCPPPCSRREAGMAANEIVGSPLRTHLVPCLLQPLSNLLISLYLDDRIWLPPPLVKAVSSIKDVIVCALEQKKLSIEKWWCYARDLVLDSDISNGIARCLSDAGILVSDAVSYWCHLPNSVDDVPNSGSYSFVNTCSGLLRNQSSGPTNQGGYRILIAGSPNDGQNHLASCILHGFVGNLEILKVDFATISQEGHGDMVQGIMGVLMKCSSLKMCALFLPRIDLWAIETHNEVSPEDGSHELHAADGLNGVACGSCPGTCDSAEFSDVQIERKITSQLWNSFFEQVESICTSACLIILATSEVPCAELPERIRQFFGSDALPSKVSVSSEYTVPRITLQLDERLNRDMVIQSACAELSRDILIQFVQFVHQRSHINSDSEVVSKDQIEGGQDCQLQNTSHGSAERPEAQMHCPEVAVVKAPAPPDTRSIRTKSNLALAISSFGYQILRYPQFAELCWVTSKLKEGPCADIRGPWKGWPFNSCIVRPENTLEKDATARSSGDIKGTDKFVRVRGLIAVGLSAYRGVHTSLAEVTSEVRKVLELLVEQINSKIQAGKDRNQFISLLSQVAYLEDVVNSWRYAMRGLELCAQTTDQTSQTKTAVKPIGDGSLEGDLVCANANAQLNGEPYHVNEGIHESEPLEKCLQGLTAETTEPIQLDQICAELDDDNSRDHMNIDMPKEKVASPVCNSMQEHGSPEKGSQMMETEKYVADRPDHMSCADVPGSTHIDELGGMTSNEKETRVKPFGSELINNLAVGGETAESMKQYNGFIDGAIPVNPNSDACSSGEVGGGERCGSFKIGNQSPSSMMDVEEGKSSGAMGVNLSSGKPTALTVEPPTFCSYSCCTGCVYALLQLVHKMVIDEWESAGGCLNVGDVHYLVSTLSMMLSSVLLKLYSTSGCIKSLNRDSQEIDKCDCRTTEGNLITPVECACHLGKSNGTEVDSSLRNQLGLNPKFVYKDGVLVPPELGKDANFHCKYETLCLCSLVDLIAITKPSR